MLSWQWQPGVGGALTLHLQPPLQLPFSKSPCSHGNRFSKYLSPPGAGRGRGPQCHLRGGPAVRAPPPLQAMSLPHPPPRAPPRLSGDQRTRVSSSLGCGSPASTLPRVPGVQVPCSYLDIADPVFQSPCESQGSEVSAEKGAGPPLLCRSWEARVLPPPPVGPGSLNPS